MWTEIKSFDELVEYMKQGFIHFRYSSGDTRARTVLAKDVVVIKSDDGELIIDRATWTALKGALGDFRPLILLKHPTKKG